MLAGHLVFVIYRYMDELPNDRALIDALHRRDEIASKSRDYLTLRALMCDDAVIMPPDAPFLQANFSAAGSAEHDPIMEYTIDMKEVLIFGTYAVEYGTISGTTQQQDGSLVVEKYKVMRTLKKVGGEWKIYRTIWNNLKTKQ